MPGQKPPSANEPDGGVPAEPVTVPKSKRSISPPAAGVPLLIAEVAGDVVAPTAVTMGPSSIDVPVTLPTAPGTYRVTITLHDPTGVAYDAATQALLPTLLVRVTGAFDGAIQVEPAVTVEAGEQFSLGFRVVNLGKEPWGRAAVGVPFGGAGVAPDDPATVVGQWIALSTFASAPPTSDSTPLPIGLAPGVPEETSLGLTAPSAPGEYLYLLDVVVPEHGSLAGGRHRTDDGARHGGARQLGRGASAQRAGAGPRGPAVPQAAPGPRSPARAAQPTRPRPALMLRVPEPAVGRWSGGRFMRRVTEPAVGRWFGGRFMRRVTEPAVGAWFGGRFMRGVTESAVGRWFGGRLHAPNTSRIGVYGVLSFSVSQRTQEMGVRIALGAQRAHVLRLVVRQGVTLAGIGILVGVAGAFGVTRVIRSLLYNVTPTDPMSFAGVAIFLTAIAFLASYLPARRATAVDPIVALRID